MAINKESVAEIIDAYADAKASKNKVLIHTMIRQLEAVLNEIFPEDAVETPQVEITE
jgi:hypothetical protein